MTMMTTTIQDSEELDFSDSSGDDFDALSRDRVHVRSMEQGDLAAIVAIDKTATGKDRTDYLSHHLQEALQHSGIRVSLVAESEDDRPVGFLMARVDFGEFGRTEPEAVIDTMGVDPDAAHHGVGHALMSQLLANLRALRVDKARAGVAWDDFAVIGFLESCGFRPSQRLALRKFID